MSLGRLGDGAFDRLLRALTRQYRDAVLVGHDQIAGPDFYVAEPMVVSASCT